MSIPSIDTSLNSGFSQPLGSVESRFSLGNLSFSSSSSIDLSLSSTSVHSNVSVTQQLVQKKNITTSIYHSFVAGFSLCSTVLGGMAHKLSQIKLTPDRPSLEKILTQTDIDCKQSYLKSTLCLNIAEIFQEGVDLLVDVNGNLSSDGNSTTHEAIAHVGGEVGVLIGMATLYLKFGEVVELRKAWSELRLGDEEGKRELMKKTVDLFASSGIMITNMGQDALAAGNTGLHLMGASSAATDTVMMGASLSLGFISGGLGIVYHAYKTVVYTMRYRNVMQEIVGLEAKIKDPSTSGVEKGKYEEQLAHLKQAKENYFLLISMNGLGTISSCLVLLGAGLAMTGAVAAVAATGVGAGVIGAVALGIGVYLLYKNNEFVKKNVDGAYASVSSGYHNIAQSFSNSLQYATKISFSNGDYFKKGYSYIAQVSFIK